MTELDANMQGLGPDTPVVTNEDGASQSDIPYRFDLLDPTAMLRLAGVLDRGARKYGDGNWRGIRCHQHINHAMTHIYAYLSDDKQDDHLGHAFARLMMAVATEEL